MKKLSKEIESNYFEVVINETSKMNLKEEKSSLFNTINEKFEAIDQVKEFIINRYGKIPAGKNKIYNDNITDDKGNNTSTGFTHSYWNKDYSHNTAKYFQTDWIQIKQIKRIATFVKL